MYNSRLWLVLFFLSVASLSQRDVNASLILYFSATAYTILCCSGETQTIFGFCMFSVLMMTVLVVSVAVAVNAITSTVSGIMLRKSHEIKYIEAVSFLKSSQRVLRCGMGC